MSRLAHTAFPSVTSSSRSRKLPPAPTNTAELRDLIESRSNLRSIYDSLIPLLQQVSEGKNDGPTGTRGKDRAARGEKLLSMPDEDLYGLNDETVKRMTAALVFIM